MQDSDHDLGLLYEYSEQDLRAFDYLGVPPPAVPYNVLLQNLMALRNERHLYRRKCDLSGAAILGAYAPDVPFPVYRNDVWWGDGWDPLSYGRGLDFSRPFFAQLAELQRVVPREGTSAFNCENCDYNSHIRESRNCYMSSLIYRCEDTHYSYWMVDDQDVADCCVVNHSKLAYECVDCENLYECVGLQDCINCQNCCFCYQLVGCQNCIGCSNLTRKNYYVQNQPVTREEFERLRASLLNGSRAGMNRGWEIYNNMWKAAQHRCVHNLNCENVVGDHLLNCRNCWNCFDGQECEDCVHVVSTANSKDVRLAYSVGWPDCEQVFGSAVIRGSQNIVGSYYIYYSANLLYCDSCHSCQECFGCIGLKHKRHCIFNQQYTPEEYTGLRDRLIDHMRRTGEWGSPLPVTLSTFAYNETAAQRFYPLSKAEVLGRGWRWRDEVGLVTERQATYRVPESIREVPDAVVNEVLQCGASMRPYRIAKEELKFYRRMQLPLPELCPEARFERRVQRRNPALIQRAVCAASGEEIFTSFPPTAGVAVVSEEAYQASLE